MNKFYSVFLLFVCWIGNSFFYPVDATELTEEVVWDPGYFSIGGGYCQKQKLIKFYKSENGARRGPFLETKLFYLHSINEDCSAGHIFEYSPSSSFVAYEVLEFYLSLLDSEALTVLDDNCRFAREEVVQIQHNTQRITGPGKVLTFHTSGVNCDLIVISEGVRSESVRFILSSTQQN